MRSLRIDFGGPGRVTVDWGATVEGLPAVAQLATVAFMTQLGSDQFLPDRGTTVAKQLLRDGVYDLMGIQHILNFSALTARTNIRKFEAAGLPATDRIGSISASLIDVNANIAKVGITVKNAAGQSTAEITELA